VSRYWSWLKKRLILVSLCLIATAPAAYGADLSYKFGFSPKSEAFQVVLLGIAGARESILVDAYSFIYSM